MTTRHAITVFVLFATAVFFTGCVNRPSGPLGDSGNPASASTPPGASNYQRLIEQFNESNSPPSSALGSQEPNFLEKATTAIKDAFTIEPKVIPAQDPTKLSTKIPKLGPELFLSAAQLAENNGNMDEAIRQYEHALDADSKSVPVLVSYARLRDRQGEFQKAVALYQRAIKVDAKNPMPHNDLGLCLARNDKWPESIKALNTAVELKPKSQRYRNNLATVLVEANRVDDALNQLLAVNSPAVAHYNLGYLLQKAKRPGEAIPHLSRASKLDPQLVAAQELLSDLVAKTAARERNVSPMRPVSHPRTQPAATATAPRRPALIQRTPPVNAGAKEGSVDENARVAVHQEAAENDSTASPDAKQAAAEVALDYPARWSNSTEESPSDSQTTSQPPADPTPIELYQPPRLLPPVEED